MHFFQPSAKNAISRNYSVVQRRQTKQLTQSLITRLNLGKSPIVVNDCPGFFVNRVLFPYFAGFSKLVVEGANFAKVDKVMENVFGWPMGPAYLLDVVGIDTAFSLYWRNG